MLGAKDLDLENYLIEKVVVKGIKRVQEGNTALRYGRSYLFRANAEHTHALQVNIKRII